VRWSGDNSTGWVADAMAILRSSGSELDWERLAACAEGRRLTVALDAALTFLRESMEAPIPEWVTARLRAAPKLRFEAAVHRASAAAPSPPRFAVASWDRYRRIARHGPPEGRPGSFLAFLQDAWQLESRARVLPHVARKLSPGAVLRSR
jgi:hypothetical protein